MSTKLPVIIVGGGIGGLALAQGLRKLAIPFHVYERDSALNVRAQGYRVRISEKGIEALKRLLTPELYSRLEDCMAVTTTPGFRPEIHLDALTCERLNFKFAAAPNIALPPPGVQPLNADRSVLRMVLSKGIEDHITFSKEFSSYTSTPSGVTANFADGTSSITGSLLVGADGKGSKVRGQLLPDHKNIDTEGRWFFGKTLITPSLLSSLHPDLASQMALVQDTRTSIPKSLLMEPVRFKNNKYSSELPADYIYWVIGCRKDALDTPDSVLLNSSHEQSAQRVLKITEDWEPSVKALFEHQEINQTSCLQIGTAKPDLPAWESTNVTLIGDAIHTISPTAGIGAVTALRSAAALANAIEDDGISKESLRKYEDEMRTFASAAIRSAFMGGKIMFGMKSLEELTRD